jgi:hypothetical protein
MSKKVKDDMDSGFYWVRALGIQDQVAYFDANNIENKWQFIGLPGQRPNEIEIVSTRLRVPISTAPQNEGEDSRTMMMVQPAVATSEEKIEVAAKALAWSQLTDLGRRTCDWLESFSEVERSEYRNQARIVLQAVA